MFRFSPKKYDDVTTLSDDDLICYCCEIEKKRIVAAIKEGAVTLKDIQAKTKACTGSECQRKNPNKRCCSKEIHQLIKLYKEIK